MSRRLQLFPVAPISSLPAHGRRNDLWQRVSREQTAASRHWGMMGFDTLNRAIEGSLVTARQKDEGNDYVVEVKFNPQDTVRYWINMQTFLIDKISTRYNSQVLIEEQRSDYRRADCMMLPFHVVTKLQGQRFADLEIQSYDLKARVPEATFTITAQ